MTTYGQDDVAAALRALGVRPGDVIFSHSNIAFFGIPSGGRTAADAVATVYRGFIDTIGLTGTLVVPTFTYSFARGEIFDRETSVSTCGVFAEAIRTRADAQRSSDPLFSVAAVGPDARKLVSDVPAECFGPGSVWERLIDADALIVNMNLDAGSTLIHYVEKCLAVPYRFDKRFEGTIVEAGISRPATAVYFVRDLARPDATPKFEPFDAWARRSGAASSAPVGRGAIVAIRARAVASLVAEMLRIDPWSLTQRAAV
jgi:aminoglycoside 3-N-acetyltransferase